MEDTSFIDLTKKENLSKIDIDPRLEDSFKRVMNKIQEYFNANGYTSRRNYKEYLEKYLLNSSDKNIRFYVNKIEKEGVGGFYVKGKSEICINENRLSLYKDSLDSTLCHEFIHFIVMHELVGEKADTDIIEGGFINEALTEMLTQQMYPKSNAYDAQIAMQKFANLVSGKQNNFQQFLEGFVDARYSSPDWEGYRHSIKNFQRDFNKQGYINLQKAQTNQNFVEAQRRLISLFLRPQNSKSIEQYIDSIDKLIDRPVKDSEYINGIIIPNMDKKMIFEMRLNNPELENFMQQKLVELRQQIVESRNAKGYEFELAGRKIQIDENHNLYGNLTGINRQWNPQTGIMTFSFNGEQLEVDTNKINFHQKEEQIEKQIVELSGYFSENYSKDLNMISSAKSLGDGLTKIEKFELPTLGQNRNITIYAATYNGKIVILNNVHKLSNVNNIDLNNFIGMTSRDSNVAAIYSANIGKIQKGITFSTLPDKNIQLRAITLYASELMSKMSSQDIEDAIASYKQSENFYEDSEEEIQQEAIRIIAEKQFPSLPLAESKAILDKIIIDNPRFVVSTKNGKIEISTLFGEKYQTAYAGKSEVLFDSKGKGLYNEIIASLSNTKIKSKGFDLPISSDGELIIEQENNIDYIFGGKGEVYKVDNVPSLHNMTIEERVNYAKSVISNYSVDSAEYSYYSSIINQNSQQKSNNVSTEEDVEDKFTKLISTYKQEKISQEKWAEYIKSDEPNIEMPKRTPKEILISIKEKSRNRKQLDEEEQKFYELINQNDTSNFYVERFAGVDPNELEWYFKEMKNIEVSGDLNSRRIR